MSLWGNNDIQADAPAIVVRTDADADTAESRLGTTQYGNTVFGVSAAEMANTTGESAHIAHGGWVVRKDRGNGRVQYEVLVAMGSIQGDAADNADDTILPQD